MSALDLLGAKDLRRPSAARKVAPPPPAAPSTPTLIGPSPALTPSTTTPASPLPDKPSSTSIPTPTPPMPGGGGGGGGGGGAASEDFLSAGAPPTPGPVPSPTPTPVASTPTPLPTPSAAPRDYFRDSDTDRDWYREQSRERDYYARYGYPPIVVEQPVYYEYAPEYVTDDLTQGAQMDGFDLLGADDAVIGFDYSALLKGAGGLLSGVAEGFGDKKPAQQPLPPPPPPPSNTWKYVLAGVGGLAALGLIVVLATRKPVAAAPSHA